MTEGEILEEEEEEEKSTGVEGEELPGPPGTPHRPHGATLGVLRSVLYVHLVLVLHTVYSPW